MSGGKQLIANIPAREWRGLVPSWEGGRLKLGMTCRYCGTTDHWSAAQMIGPQAAIPKIIQLGWGVGKVTCPACLKAKRHKPEEKVAPMKLEKPAIEAEVANADGLKKNKRLVILALEDYFDEAVKRYRDGKSDAFIAKELDLSETFVKNVREEFYGQIAEPEEVAALRGDIAAVKARADELERKLETLCSRNGWKV